MRNRRSGHGQCIAASNVLHAVVWDSDFCIDFGATRGGG